jgi:hypothetical protein
MSSEKIKSEIIDFLGNYKSYNDFTKPLNKIKVYSKGLITFYVLTDDLDTIIKKYEKEILKNLDRVHTFTNNSYYNIYLCLSPFQKKFNMDPTKPLTKININSAFTYLNKPDIYIFRKEEMGKVMFHEIIHHIPEIHSQFKESNINRLKEHFNIKTLHIDPNESIVEFWATIMFLKQISNETQKDFFELYLEELKYSLYKSYQIFKLQKQNNYVWLDYTHVYCYIIFKTIIMYNLPEFQKIYTFPYNDDVITDFLIKYSNLPLPITSNPTTKRADNSLCFMVNSDC